MHSYFGALPLASTCAPVGARGFLKSGDSMASSFSIPNSFLANAPASALHDEVRAHTGCDEEADSILRGIERLGDDPSIRRYEMTPMTNNRSYRGAPRLSWSVRAVRF